jgi:hypothetical protein
MSIMASRFPEGHSWMYRWGVTRDYVVTVGKLDPEQVARVNLTHDTGEVTTPAIAGNYFVSFAPAAGVCQAEARDYAGKVVETLQHGDVAAFGHLGSSDAMQSCE